MTVLLPLAAPLVLAPLVVRPSLLRVILFCGLHISPFTLTVAENSSRPRHAPLPSRVGTNVRLPSHGQAQYRLGHVGFAPAAQVPYPPNAAPAPLRSHVGPNMRLPFQGPAQYRLGNRGFLGPVASAFHSVDFSRWTPEQVLEFQRNQIYSESLRNQNH